MERSDQYLRLDEAAQEADVTIRTIQNWIDARQVQTRVDVDRRRRLISRADFEAMLAAKRNRSARRHYQAGH